MVILATIFILKYYRLIKRYLNSRYGQRRLNTLNQKMLLAANLKQAKEI